MNWRNLVSQHASLLKEQYNRRRAMWVMHHIGGETFKAIADKFGLSIGMVYQHVVKFDGERRKPDPIETYIYERGDSAKIASALGINTPLKVNKHPPKIVSAQKAA